MIVRELVAKFGYSFDKGDADKFDERVKQSKKAAEQSIEAVKREAAAAKEAAESDAKARRKAADEKIKAAREALAAAQRAIEAEIRALKKLDDESESAFRARTKAAKESARERIQAARDAAKAEIEAATRVKEAIADETKAAISGYRAKVDAAQAAAKDRIEAEQDVIEAERKADEKRTKALETGRERLRGFLQSVGDATKRVVQVASVGAVALGAGAIAATNEKQQQLVGLETQLGSSAAANAEYARLKKFGRASGIGGNAAIDSFTRLKGLGVASDDRSITGFANIAAGTAGKSTNDIIEAVADAATGEFERLKEFGFKASSQGDQVAVTFRGVTTTIEKNSQAITEYLTAIGNNEFDGAVERKGKTLGGTFERLKESASDFLVTVGEAGLGKAVGEIAKKLDTTTQGGKALAAQLGEFLARAARSLFDLFTQALPILTSLVELFMGLVDALGGPKGLILMLVAGKTAMASMNLAMTAMTSGSTAAAGALRGIALAGGAASIALAGAAVIVGHFEDKINRLKSAAREDDRKNTELQKQRVLEADDATLGDHIRQFREGIASNTSAKSRAEAQLAMIKDVGTTDLDEARSLETRKNNLAASIERYDEEISKQQELLDAAIAEDSRRFQESGGRSSRGTRSGQMMEGSGDDLDPAKGATGYGPQFKATISAAEASRRRAKNAIDSRAARLGATPEAQEAALAKYEKSIAKGDSPAKALKDATKIIDTSVGYTAPKAGKKKIGTLDEEAFAKFEAEAREKAEGYGSTEAGIQEALDEFRATQEYKGGNAKAARKAALSKLRGVSGLGAVSTAKRKQKTGTLDKEAYAEFEKEARRRAGEYGSTEAGIDSALKAFRDTMEYDGGNVAAAKKAGIDSLRKDSGLSGNDGLTITDMLDRDFGAGNGVPGGSPESRGGGGLGTTINRIDQSFAPVMTFNFEVTQADGEDGTAFADRVKEQVETSVRGMITESYNHFASKV